MPNRLTMFLLLGITLACTCVAYGQTELIKPDQKPMQPDSRTVAVPGLVNFSGVVRDANGDPMTGVVGLTFSIYRDQEGGAALWSEIQNVSLDANGRYSVLLGGATNGGLPVELFSKPEGRWLAIRPELSGSNELPRVLIVSVPYALKAADADTLGGKPASAFMMVPDASDSSSTPHQSSASTNNDEPTVSAAVAPGVINRIAKYGAPDGSDNIVAASNISEVGGNVGIGTADPNHLLHLKSTNAELQLESAGTGAGNFALQSFFAAGSRKFNFGIDGDIGVNKLAVYDATTGTYPLTITGGNIGFGTTSPTHLLHLKNQTAEMKIEATNAAAGNYAVQSFWAAGSRKFNLGVDGDIGSSKLAVYDATTGTYPTTWSNGFVGIGTTNPTHLLHLKAQTAEMKIEANAAAAGNYALQSFWAGGARKFNFGVDGDLGVNKFALYDNVAGAYSSVWSDGNLGVGTTTPTSKLEVVGNLKISGIGNGVNFADGSSLSSANPVNAARIRGITYLAGCDSCSILATSDDQKNFYLNIVGPMTVNEIRCFTDSGQTSINIRRNGTLTDMIAGNLNCTTGGGTATPVLGESVLALFDRLDFEMVTVDNTAKRVTVVIKATVN